MKDPACRACRNSGYQARKPDVRWPPARVTWIETSHRGRPGLGCNGQFRGSRARALRARRLHLGVESSEAKSCSSASGPSHQSRTESSELCDQSARTTRSSPSRPTCLSEMILAVGGQDRLEVHHRGGRRRGEGRSAHASPDDRDDQPVGLVLHSRASDAPEPRAVLHALTVSTFSLARRRSGSTPRAGVSSSFVAEPGRCGVVQAVARGDIGATVGPRLRKYSSRVSGREFGPSRDLIACVSSPWAVAS